MGVFSGSDMKELKKSENYTVHAVGDSIYVLVPKDPPQRVIITAHGGHKVLSKTNSFKVPTDTVLQFYSDDTFSVKDPGFSDFFTKLSVPKEVLSEGDTCFDYVLSKYQGRHGNKKETYQSIGTDIDDMYRAAKNHASNVSKYEKMGMTEKAQQNKDLAAFKSKVPAVMTVRNRWGKGDVTLSIAIDAVKHAAGSVQVFDCLFCRSTLFGGSQDVQLISPT